MNRGFKVVNLEGPLAWVVLALAAVLGLVLAVWVLSTALVIAILAPPLLYLYGAIRSLVYRRRRLPGGWRRR